MAQKRRVRVDTGETVARPDFHVPAVKPRPGQAAPSAPEDTEEINCTCPRLDRDDWHEVESDWSDATFVRTALTAALGVPLGYNAVREKLGAMARAIGAAIPEDAMLLLGEGKFRRPVMLEVEGVPAGERRVHRPGGIAYSRLVPAPMGQIRRVVADTVEAARERYGRPPDDTWLWYLTCRICSAERDFETLVIAHYRQVPGA